MCLDGTQAAGACILGQCGASFSCVNGTGYVMSPFSAFDHWVCVNTRKMQLE